MKYALGIEVGAVLCLNLVGEDGHVGGRVVDELPAHGTARRDALESTLGKALERLPDRAVEAIGLACAPADGDAVSVLHDGGVLRADLPRIGGRHLDFMGVEIEALYAFGGGGQSKAWMILGEQPRLYVEEGDFGERIVCRDEKGIERKVMHEICRDLLLPLEALRNSFGIFESYLEIEETAALVRNSDGVRMAVRDDGLAVFGLDSARGVRRPQICRAALESVAAEVRNQIAELAGEGVVRELYVAGPASRNRLLLELIADLIDVTVIRSEIRDAVAAGAACRAAESVGFPIRRPDRTRLLPTMPAVQRDELYARWLAIR